MVNDAAGGGELTMQHEAADNSFAELSTVVSAIEGNELGLTDTSLTEHTLTEQKWLRSNRYGFCVGGYNLLAQANHYCELLVDPKPSALPNSPVHFKGVMNVRGNLIPLYQLEPLLDLPLRRSRYAIILGELSHAAALVVEGKPLPISEASLQLTENNPSHLASLPALLQRSLVATHHVDSVDSDGTARETWYTLNHRLLFSELASSYS